MATEFPADLSISLNLGDSGEAIGVSEKLSPKQVRLSLFQQLPHVNKVCFSLSSGFCFSVLGCELYQSIDWLGKKKLRS